MRLGSIFYNDFELLDAYGPLEMFGALGDKIELVTIAEQGTKTMPRRFRVFGLMASATKRWPEYPMKWCC